MSASIMSCCAWTVPSRPSMASSMDSCDAGSVFMVAPFKGLWLGETSIFLRLRAATISKLLPSGAAMRGFPGAARGVWVFSSCVLRVRHAKNFRPQPTFNHRQVA